MNCPKCGGPTWDNRNDKRNPRSPDYKCKNKQCGEGVWEKKSAIAPAVSNGNGHGAPLGGRPLATLYYDCLDVAKRIVSKQLANPTNEEILSATATIFIAASRDGAPLLPAKPAPAPPPPPPPPAPEPVPDPYYDNRDLPF